jgi:hypothetical protein
MQNSPLAQQNTTPAATKNVAFGRSAAWAAVAVAAVLAGCASKPMPPQAPSAPPPVATPAPAARPATPPPVAAGLPAVRTWAEYRRRAAQIMMAANPGGTFAGAGPEQWYGIPVVQVMLNGDGTIRNVDFMRQSKVGPETNNMALQAVRRVASFGPVSNLPQPWQFNETFLYNDNLKFQLVTIVENR